MMPRKPPVGFQGNTVSSALPGKLAIAQRAGVISQLARLRASFLGGLCIAADNQMASGAKDFLRDLLAGSLTGVPARPYPDMIGEYVAASSFMHCYDAHSYLASAWDTTLQGDASVALHLAYYSELRSAMGLLACDGIGVFHDNHCVVDAAGNSINVADEGKTHSFCWNAYDWWTTSPNAKALLDQVIVDGQPVSVWLTSFPSGAALLTTCSSYLSGIGLDIQLLSRNDQATRGKASYRPRGIEGVPSRPVGDDLTLLGTIGEHMIGSNGPRDGSLGSLILCAILRRAFELNRGSAPQDAFVAFEAEVQTMIAAMGPNSPTEAVLRRYCMTDPLPTIPVLGDALEKVNGEIEGVLSRAALLCFHSVLYARRMLNDSGITEQNLSFWWLPALEARGALAAGTASSSQDVAQDSLDAHGDFLKILAMPDRKSLWEQCASVMANACRCERIAVAGLFA